MNAAIIVVITLLIYAWLIYPLLVMLIGWVMKRKSAAAPAFPTGISIILSAHNEQSVIRSRLENLSDVISHAAASIPGLKAEIHIGLDACTDRTKEIVDSYLEERKNGKTEKRNNPETGELRSGASDSVQFSSVVPLFRSFHIHEFTKNIGKPAVLKDIVRKIKDNEALFMPEILVFTDANTHFQQDALLKLLGRFSDDKVGGVCGKLIFQERKMEMSLTEHTEKKDDLAKNPQKHNFTSPPQADNETLCELGALAREHSSSSSASPAVPAAQTSSVCAGSCGFLANESCSSPESAYWDLEAKIKEAESRIDSCLGANGAIYAIRSRLFWDALPANTIVDDFVIGMKVREAGYRMVYAPEAVAEEELPEESSEWKRRVRIGAGDFQALYLCSRTLLPRYGFFALSFFSHKVLRWLTPHLILILLAVTAADLVLTGSLLARCVAAGFVICSMLASLGAVFKERNNGTTEKRNEIITEEFKSGASDSVPCRSAPSPGSNPFFPFSVVPLFRLSYHGLMMQAALFTGFLRFCRGGLSGSWERTAR